MKKITTNIHEINKLEDLIVYRAQLKRNYREIGEEIMAGAKDKVKAIPSNLFKKKARARVGGSDRDKLKATLPVIAAKLVKSMLPKKMGFIERLLAGFIANKTAIQLISTERNISVNTKESLIPLPIAMKRLITNEPDAQVGMHKTNANIAKTTAKPKEKLSLKGIWSVIKDSFSGFSEHKVTKISGSLAYYTVFSMAPLLVMIIALCGVFLEKDAAQGQIFLQLKGFLGAETAAQLQELIKNAAIGDKGVIASIIGGVTLLIGATSIFADIQDSINTIWGIKPKPKRGWLKMLQNRFLSFSVIVSLGFVLLVSLGVSAILDGFSEKLKVRFEDVSVILFNVLNVGVTFVVITVIFGVIFKVLPDAKIRWRDVAAGAMVTAVLFMLGKFAISFYIGQSNVGGTFGAAGSLVVLLLWAYYSSIILYFGAEFTKAYAVRFGAEIHPNAYAVTTKEIEVEQGSASVQQNEQSK